jgi:Fe-S cluster biosynthesis and repair protein YggX
MSKTVYCAKLKLEAPALDFPPMPGDMGKQIFEQISKPAWQEWMARQTILINENRLNLLDVEARSFLLQEMKQFLFEETEKNASSA